MSFAWETLVVPILSSIVGGLLVAIANHAFTRRRESARRLSDTRTEMLMMAWKKIEAASNIEDWGGRERAKLYTDLEDAYASIMLLGSDSQILAAKELATAAAQGPSASTLNLLNILRDDLRDELGLTKTSERYAFLRMKLNQ